MKQVTLYCDGACSPNPGNGGWAALLFYKSSYREFSDGPIPETTNQRMELTALIRGLLALKEPCEVSVYTDSRYLQQGMMSWRHKWKEKGLLVNPEAGRSRVANADLWLELDRLSREHSVTVYHVKGHNGDKHNERADWLAQQRARREP